MAIKSLDCPPEVCVCRNDNQSKSFHKSVDLWQGYVWSPNLFLNLHELDGQAQPTGECVTNGRWKISRLLFADDFVLPTSSESSLQHALNGFAAAYVIGGMKISISKTEVLCLSNKSCLMPLQVGVAGGES